MGHDNIIESSLAWLDFDEKARQTMQEHLALLNQPDTMDQLGIGQVRDVFSYLFFPGTSTLWRRARYTLFIPWIYRELEENGTGGGTGEVASRRKQARLIRALKNGDGDDTIGLIGARKDEPQRMPDELIWNGLHSWGIRRRDGSRSKYWRMLEAGDASLFEVGRGDFGEALDAASGSWWHERLPMAPLGYLESTDFTLPLAEASFLRDQLREHAPESLLARMTQDPPLTGEGDFPWEDTNVTRRLSPEMRTTMDHARVFSYGMQGAGLLYSYFVAKKKGGPNAEDLSNRLAEWSTRIRHNGARVEIRGWSKRRDDFWALIKTHNTGLRMGTEHFVDDWMAMASRAPGQLLEDDQALAMLQKREWDVKRHFARLSSEKALDRARDESGTGQLDYRWSQGSQIVNDIVGGLNGGGD
jgi:Family of unknown function (DUF6361)